MMIIKVAQQLPRVQLKAFGSEKIVDIRLPKKIEIQIRGGSNAAQNSTSVRRLKVLGVIVGYKNRERKANFLGVIK
jgi:hypothetical protein